MPHLVARAGCALARRWALALFVVLGFLGMGAVWAAQQQPVYQASTTVGVPAPTDHDLGLIAEEAIRVSSPAVRTSIEDQVAGPTSSELDLELRPRITTDAGTITFTVHAPNPSVAQLVSQSYAEVYLEQRLVSQPDSELPLQVTTPATFPLSPQSPHLWRTALISAATGLIAAALASLAVERFRPKRDVPAAVSELALDQPLSHEPKHGELSPLGSDWLTADSPAAAATATTATELAPELGPAASDRTQVPRIPDELLSRSRAPDT